MIKRGTTEDHAVGKSPLTAQGSSPQLAVGKVPLAPPVPLAPKTDLEAARKELEEVRALVAQQAQEAVALRSKIAQGKQPASGDGSDSDSGSEISDADLDSYLQEVQLFQAQVGRVVQAKVVGDEEPEVSAAPPRGPSPTPSASSSEEEEEEEAAASSSSSSSSSGGEAATAAAAASSSQTPQTPQTPANRGPARVRVATTVAPAGTNWDLIKRASKATSYGLSLLGAGASMLGWSAAYHVSRVQGIGQVSGSIGKNIGGAVGDFADYKDKTANGRNADGLLLKVGGQTISTVGQILTLAGMVATNGLVLRAVGSFVNAAGMAVTGVGELQPPGDEKNVAKAAANFVGAVFAALGGVGFTVDQTTVGLVADEVARSFDAAATTSSATTAFGNAVDDSKNSRAAGATKRERFMHDPKPAGNGISAIGGVLHTAALVLNKVATTAKPEDEAKIRIAARVLGSVGSFIMATGNGFTAKGEWKPAQAPADEEQRIAMQPMGNTPAPAAT